MISNIEEICFDIMSGSSRKDVALEGSTQQRRSPRVSHQLRAIASDTTGLKKKQSETSYIDETPRGLIHNFIGDHDTVQTPVRQKSRLGVSTYKKSMSSPRNTITPQNKSPSPARSSQSRSRSNALRRRATLQNILRHDQDGPTPRTMIQGLLSQEEAETPIVGTQQRAQEIDDTIPSFTLDKTRQYSPAEYIDETEAGQDQPVVDRLQMLKSRQKSRFRQGRKDVHSMIQNYQAPEDNYTQNKELIIEEPIERLVDKSHNKSKCHGENTEDNQYSILTEAEVHHGHDFLSANRHLASDNQEQSSSKTAGTPDNVATGPKQAGNVPEAEEMTVEYTTCVPRSVPEEAGDMGVIQEESNVDTITQNISENIRNTVDEHLANMEHSHISRMDSENLPTDQIDGPSVNIEGRDASRRSRVHSEQISPLEDLSISNMDTENIPRVETLHGNTPNIPQDSQHSHSRHVSSRRESHFEEAALTPHASENMQSDHVDATHLKEVEGSSEAFQNITNQPPISAIPSHLKQLKITELLHSPMTRPRKTNLDSALLDSSFVQLTQGVGSAPGSSKPTAAKPVPRRGPRAQKEAQKKSTAVPRLPKSLTKGIFEHFSKHKVKKDVLESIEKVADTYWKHLTSDLSAYANHAHRKSIEHIDVELLMRRQGFTSEKQSMYTLVERYLPLEYRQEIIPIARAGNKIYPQKRKH